MNIIETTLDSIKGAVANVAQTGFASTAGEIGNVITIGAGLLLLIMGLNMLMQIQPMTSGSFFAFGWKVALIGIAAQSWDNFAVVYSILSDVPENLGKRAMAATGSASAETLYAALDSMLFRVTEYGEQVSDEAGWFLGGLLATVFFLLAGIFAAIAAGVIAYGMIMFTVMIVIAPAMILTALFPPTKDVFAAWSRATIGYAMIPLVAGGILGVIVSIGTAILNTAPAASDATSLGTILPFVVVMLLSLGVMSSIPSIAGNVSGMIGLASNAAGLSSMANRGISSAASMATGNLTKLGLAAGKATLAVTGAGAALSAVASAAGVGGGGTAGGSGGTPQYQSKYSPGEKLARFKALRDG